MANIALGKLPLEKEWKKAESATDGLYNDYGSYEGFADGNWPLNYTLDFESPINIACIRFLIWDGLGTTGARKPANRQYKFSLSISLDNENYFELYSNRNNIGANGWFSFEFLNETHARYIRLECIDNTANKGFHIVEFEVHDTTPEQIASTNKKEFTLNSVLPSYDRVNQIIDDAIDKKLSIVNELEKTIDSIKQEEQRFKDSLKTIRLLEEAKTFHEESIENKNNANRWLKYSLIIAGVFTVIIAYFIWRDNKPVCILKSANENNFLESHTTILLSFYYIGKAVLISVILFALGWALKNYRSEMHNYTINKHKSLSLVSAINIMTKPEFSNIDKKAVFSDVLSIVFSHQNSGYSESETKNPNMISSIIKNNIPE